MAVRRGRGATRAINENIRPTSRPHVRSKERYSYANYEYAFLRKKGFLKSVR